MCEALDKQGKLDEKDEVMPVNICALYINQRFMISVMLFTSYSFTLKCWFSYILFKYAHQLQAKDE